MSSQQDGVTPGEHANRKPRRGGPEAPIISLDQPGRLRVRHLCALFSTSRPTFYVRLRAGLLPRPDGYDGRFPWWSTATVRKALGG